jgi:hypothetical protein
VANTPLVTLPKFQVIWWTTSLTKPSLVRDLAMKLEKESLKQVKLKFFSTLFNNYQKVKYIHRNEDKNS